jgi:hypothetical protein
MPINKALSSGVVQLRLHLCSNSISFTSTEVAQLSPQRKRICHCVVGYAPSAEAKGPKLETSHLTLPQPSAGAKNAWSYSSTRLNGKVLRTGAASHSLKYCICTMPKARCSSHGTLNRSVSVAFIFCF